jgi:hypothetical protein
VSVYVLQAYVYARRDARNMQIGEAKRCSPNACVRLYTSGTGCRVCIVRVMYFRKIIRQLSLRDTSAAGLEPSGTLTRCTCDTARLAE